MEIVLQQPPSVYRQHMAQQALLPITSIGVPSAPLSITTLTAESFHSERRSRSPHNTNRHHQAEPVKKSPYSKTRFWLDMSTWNGVVALQSSGAYTGNIVDSNDDSYCVQETTSRTAVYLPYYISKLPSYTEAHCRVLIRQLAEDIQVLHQAKVAHRNLHIHNVLIDRQGQIQIKGLRYAKALQPGGQPLVGFSGFRHNWYAFRAPESEGDDPHNERVDVWSLGAILYLLLTGLPPFRGSGRQLTYNKLTANIEYDMIIPSEKAQDLVEKMLKVNPRERLTIDQVQEHEWFQESTNVLVGFDLSLAQDFFRDWEKKPKMSPTVRPAEAVRFEV